MLTASGEDLRYMQYEIVEPVKRVEIPLNEAIVVGGAAMHLFGIKRAYDIDLVVTPEVMVDVLGRSLHATMRRQARFDGERRAVTFDNQGAVTEDEGYGVYYGGLTYMLAPNDDLYRATFDELHDEAAVIDGVLVSPPERILTWKQGVGRQKDQNDIALLKLYLSRVANL